MLKVLCSISNTGRRGGDGGREEERERERERERENEHKWSN
jgi:hypothetical protein